MSFGDRFLPAEWQTFGELGSYWQLLSFEEKKPPIWEQFWRDHRKYWGVDDPAARRTRPWFWETFTEESFLAKAEAEYQKLVIHYSRWLGAIALRQPVQVIRLAANRLVLSMEWKGKISDHTDLDLHLYRKHKIFLIPEDFVCDIFSYGTLVTLPDSEEVIIGAASPGTQRVQHNKATVFGEQNYSVSYERTSGLLRIWDATFQTNAQKYLT